MKSRIEKIQEQIKESNKIIEKLTLKLQHEDDDYEQIQIKNNIGLEKKFLSECEERLEELSN